MIHESSGLARVQVRVEVLERLFLAGMEVVPEFIPYYYSLDAAEKTITEKKYAAIIYTNETFHCDTKACRERVRAFEQRLAAHGLVFARAYGSRTYSIYVVG